MYKFLTSVLTLIFTKLIRSDREFAASEVMAAVLLMIAALLVFFLVF